MRDIQATIEIDLTQSQERLWENLNKDARWGVKKGEKSGLKINIVDKNIAWDKFYDIYKNTIIKGGIAPENKQELRKEVDLLLLCTKENQIIAGAGIRIEGEKVILVLNASLREFLKFQPNNLLYWEMIKWAKNNSYKTCDLGGYQLNAKPGNKLYEINKFKERWGGELKKYYVYSKNPLYIIGRKIIRNSSYIKNFRDKIKLKRYLLENNKSK